MNNEMREQQIPGSHIDAQVEQRLEQIIAAACRAQPLLPAPANLHSRIMAAVERRASQWWRAPLRAWPIWAQTMLVLLCLCCTWLVTSNLHFGANGASVEQWLFLPWMLADIFTSLLSVLRELLWLMLRISPVLWFFAVISSGVAVVIGVMGLNRLTTHHA